MVFHGPRREWPVCQPVSPRLVFDFPMRMYCLDCGNVRPVTVLEDGLQRLVCPHCQKTLGLDGQQCQRSQEEREEAAPVKAAQSLDFFSRLHAEVDRMAAQ